MDGWVQIAVFIVSLLGFYGALERRLSSIAERVARIEGKLERLKNAEAKGLD